MPHLRIAASPHLAGRPRRLASIAAAPWLIGLIGLIGVGAAGAIPAGAQGERPGASPAGPPPEGSMPPPTAQVLADEIQDTAVSLRDAALKGTKAWSHLSSLTTEIGPRPAGSAGDRRAVAWAVRTLQGLGFSNVHTEKVTVQHWVRGEEAGEITAPYPQRVALAALGGSIGTPAAGIEAPVVEVASLGDLEHFDAAKVKGKIVFFNTTTDRTRDGSGYGRTVPVRAQGPSRAAKLGAVAVVVRSIGTDSNRLPHTGGLRYDASVTKIPAAALSGPDADLLAAEIAGGKPVRFRLRLGARTLAPAESANVIGEIPGREKPEEIVLLGAHLDSWDLGTGAIDDGAGCAIVVEAARRIGELKPRPRRTLRVVLFANEELGLSGAEAYAKAHAEELPRHVLALESDLGSGRVWLVESRVAVESMGWVRELARLVHPIGAVSGTNQAEGGPDLGPLLRAGVPTVSLTQDATAYFDFHHTANDTLDKANARDLDYNVAAWSAVVYAAAELPGDFGRITPPPPHR
jgi:Zn-dependent M28 family amino/carboxypeptidase